MEHTQTKLINYYSSVLPSWHLAPSHLRLIVVLRPSQSSSSYALSVFYWFFKKQYVFTTIEMSLVQTNGILAIVFRAQTWDNQRPWPARCATYWSAAHTERKMQTWKGLGVFVETKITSFLVVFVPTSFIRRPEWQFRGNFEEDRGMITTNPYKDRFCHTFGQLFDRWNYIVRARQNDGEISHFHHAETTSQSSKNRCVPKIFKTILRLNCL